MCLISALPTFANSSFFQENSFSGDGGVSGGGGNVISPTPPDRYIDPDHVEHLVKNSVDGVKTYFFESERKYRRGLPVEEKPYQKIYDALFDREINIHEIIKRNFPEVEDSRPCFDLDRNPVDGSFKSNGESEICISAYNLAKKVNIKEMEAQSIALMAHEYVELAGLSDDDAVTFQKKVLKDLK
jgi:hypothetical protein